jgi:hypothetical protein
VECVGRGLDPGEVAPPLGFAHVVVISPCLAVDELAKDVGMAGMLGSLGNHADQKDTQRGVPPILRPMGDRPRGVELEILDGPVCVRASPLDMPATSGATPS